MSGRFCVITELLFAFVHAEKGVAAIAGYGGEVQAGIDVLVHGLAGQSGHTHPDGGDDGDMVIEHTGHPWVILTAAVAQKAEHGRLIHSQLWQYLLIALYEVGIAAGVYNKAMKGHIRVFHALYVLGEHAVLKGLSQRIELSHRGIVGGRGAESRRLTFNRDAYPLEVYHILQVETEDKAAALPLVLHHKAYLCQAAYGLGHRRAGNSQRR